MAVLKVSRGLYTVSQTDVVDTLNQGAVTFTQDNAHFGAETFNFTTTFNSTANFNSVANFSSSVNFTGTVTFNNGTTAINSGNIHLGDGSSDIIFVNGGLRLYNTGLSNYAKFDMSLISANRTFKFPDISGSTIAVVDLAQTWTATQTFSAATGIVVTGVATFDNSVNLGNASTDIIAVNGTLAIVAKPDFLVSTSGSAGALAGYINVKVGGVDQKMPYYNV